MINQVAVRFADEQSVIVMFVSVFAAHLMVSTPSIVELAALSIVANPMPIILGLCALERDRSLVRVQTRRPFDHTHLQAGLAQFIEGVPAGSTILVAFDDPRGEYERIFDGQRTLLDLPQFIAGSRSIHLFPDWHAVAETNFEGGPDFWGRSPQAVLDNSRRWRTTHVIVYQDSPGDLDPAWSQQGFTPLAVFDWGEWVDALEGAKLWRSDKPPCWHLLAPPSWAANGSDEEGNSAAYGSVKIVPSPCAVFSAS